MLATGVPPGRMRHQARGKSLAAEPKVVSAGVGIEASRPIGRKEQPVPMLLWIAFAALAAASACRCSSPSGARRGTGRSVGGGRSIATSSPSSAGTWTAACGTRGGHGGAHGDRASPDPGRRCRCWRPAKGGRAPPHAPPRSLIVAMPLAALALYLTLGSPGVPDQPLDGASCRASRSRQDSRR